MFYRRAYPQLLWAQPTYLASSSDSWRQRSLTGYPSRYRGIECYFPCDAHWYSDQKYAADEGCGFLDAVIPAVDATVRVWTAPVTGSDRLTDTGIRVAGAEVP